MNGRMVIFLLEDTVSVKKNLRKHLLLVSLFVSFSFLIFYIFYCFTYTPYNEILTLPTLIKILTPNTLLTSHYIVLSLSLKASRGLFFCSTNTGTRRITGAIGVARIFQREGHTVSK